MAKRLKAQTAPPLRDAIVDAAEQLLITKGYERMTIADILTRLDVSKGGFYHHFDSKESLLEAIIERMLDRAETALTPIVQDSQGSALQKVQRLFDVSTQVRSERKAVFLSLLPVYYDDRNAVFRQKMQRAKVQRLAPLLAEVIRQGVREGALATQYPDQTANVVWGMEQDLSDHIGHFLLRVNTGKAQADTAEVTWLRQTSAAYAVAIARVLGAPDDSLDFGYADALDDWVSAALSGIGQGEV